MNCRLLLLFQLDLALLFLTRANGFPTVPQKYFVFGLPFSGVDYVQRLLDAAHFAPSTLSDCSTTKSASIDLNTNQSSIMTFWKYEPFGWKEMKKLSSCSANETLFILVTKDPFAWLSSVARRRFKAKKSLSYAHKGTHSCKMGAFYQSFRAHQNDSKAPKLQKYFVQKNYHNAKSFCILV